MFLLLVNHKTAADRVRRGRCDLITEHNFKYDHFTHLDVVAEFQPSSFLIWNFFFRKTISDV
jgi:hypothetical protein